MLAKNELKEFKSQARSVLVSYKKILSKLQSVQHQNSQEIDQLYLAFRNMRTDIQKSQSKTHKALKFLGHKKIVKNTDTVEKSFINFKDKVKTLLTIELPLEYEFISQLLPDSLQKKTSMEAIITHFFEISPFNLKTLFEADFEQLLTVKKKLTQIKETHTKMKQGLTKITKEGIEKSEEITNELITIISLCDSEGQQIRHLSYSFKLLRRQINSLFAQYEKIGKEYTQFTLDSLTPKDRELIQSAYDKQHELRNILEEQRKMHEIIEPSRLIAVRLTDHFPHKGVLIPANRKTIYLRETIHFTLNTPVNDHGGSYTSWNDMDYGILIPGQQMFERFIYLNTADAFIVGEFTLPRGTEIIINTQVKPTAVELTKMQKEIPQALFTFVPEGVSIHQFIEQRISEKGYTLMHGGEYGWMSPKYSLDKFMGKYNNHLSEHQVRDLFKEFATTQGKDASLHGLTPWREVEKLYSHFLAILKNGENEDEYNCVFTRLEKVKLELENEIPKFTTKEENKGIKLILKKVSFMRAYLKKHKARLISKSVA